MKGLNIKKLAAIAAGGALVGSAIAPIVSAGTLELTKSDIFNDSGTPKVKIVVGSQSVPSDGVWAGNIAAAIANQARVYKPVTVSGEGGSSTNTPSVADISAKLVIGGTVTYSNSRTFITGETAGTTDMNSDTSATDEIPGVELTKSSFGTTNPLKDLSTTITWNNSSYSRTFKEKLGVKADVYFDYDNSGSVSDLEAEIVGGGASASADLNYVLDLGSGIPVYESTTSGTFFTDGSNDNIVIPFFGENYLVREVNKTSNFLRLIKSDETKSFNEGDIVPDLPGKNALAGQTVSVRIDSIVATGPAAGSYSADVTLIDGEGNERITKTVSTGENIHQVLTVDGQEAVDIVLYVDSIGVAASSGIGTVKLLIGTNLVDLYKDKGYPYDSSKTSDFAYRVDLLYSTDNNFLTKVVVFNDGAQWRDSGTGTYLNPPLYAPDQALTPTGQAGSDEMAFLGIVPEGTLGKDFFKVKFDGLETNEPVTTIKFYNHTLEFRDTSDRAHKLPLSIVLSKDGDSSFSFDNRTLYYRSSSTNTYFDINSAKTGGAIVNGVYVSNRIDSNQGANNTVRFVWGDGTDQNLIQDGEVDINGFYFTIADKNGGLYEGTPPSGVMSDKNAVTLRADGNITFSTAAIGSSGSNDFLESWTTNDGNAINSLFWADANTADYVAYNGNTVTLKGQDDVTYEYAMFTESAVTGNLWLLFDRSNSISGRYDADIKLWQVDLNEGVSNAPVAQPPHTPSVTANVGTRPYYWLNDSKFGGGVSNVYYTAKFGVETAGDTTTAAEATADYDTNLWIDVGTGYAPDLPNTNLTAPTVDINFNGVQTDGSVAFSLDEDPATSNPQKAFNDFGTYFEVGDDRSITIQVPDNRRRPVFVVQMEGSSSEVTGGEELVVAEGETGTTSTGTRITVEEITYTASCGAGDTTGGTCAADPENYFEPVNVSIPLVFLDSEAPSGRLVLVGGHLVNRLTAEIADIGDVLTAPSDGSAAWVDVASGNFVVAGYTAADTVLAARDFISSIEAIDMMG